MPEPIIEAEFCIKRCINVTILKSFLLFSLPIFVERHDRSHLLTITYSIESFSAKIFLLEHIRKWGTFLLTKASPYFSHTVSAYILYHQAKSNTFNTYILGDFFRNSYQQIKVLSITLQKL